MSTWISDEKGMLHPAKERVALKNLSEKTMVKEMVDMEGKRFKVSIPPGGDYIYEGPDRDAIYQWWEQNGRPSADEMKKMDGQVTFGEDFKNNTEFLKQFGNARQAQGFNTIDEYLKFLGHNPEKNHAEFEKKSAAINVHDLPPRINEIKKLGGGINTAAGSREANRYGGFGEIPEK